MLRYLTRSSTTSGALVRTTRTRANLRAQGTGAAVNINIVVAVSTIAVKSSRRP